MRNEKLLEAIGDIDDRLIEEAAPGKKSKITHINWVRYGSIAACILLFVVLMYGVSTIRMGSKEEAAADAAAPEAWDDAMEMETDGAVEEEAAMEEAPANDTPADDASVETEEDGAGNLPDENDIAYGIVVNDTIYFPISFEDRKNFDLVPEDASGLTPENTYQITESDLGEVIGAVTVCKKEEYVGLTLYHFANYPENDSIGILDINGTYEFYVSESPYLGDW